MLLLFKGLNPVVDVTLSEYNIDTVLPSGYFNTLKHADDRTDWTIQVTMFAFGDILHDTPLGSGSSDEFNIVSGGPSPQVSVTVLNTATLSTIGGTIYTALTGDAAGQGDFAPSFTPFLTTAAARTHTFGGTKSSTFTQPTSSSAPTSASQNTTAPTAADSVDGLSQGALIGVAVGVTAIIVIGACFAGWWFWPRRRRNSEKLDDVNDIPLSSVDETHLSSGRLGRGSLSKEGADGDVHFAEDEETVPSGRVNTRFSRFDNYSHNLQPE